MSVIEMNTLNIDGLVWETSSVSFYKELWRFSFNFILTKQSARTYQHIELVCLKLCKTSVLSSVIG